jgi:hypothetical protein
MTTMKGHKREKCSRRLTAVLCDAKMREESAQEAFDEKNKRFITPYINGVAFCARLSNSHPARF